MTRIDWREYFREFSLVHGGDPVLYKQNPSQPKSGYLLFPDGWMYCSWNVKGPEYPPPSDRIQHLARISEYWRIKKAICEESFRQKRLELEDLIKAQQGRSASLMVPSLTVTETEDGQVHRQMQSRAIDFTAMLEDLQSLKVEISRCNQHLSSPTIPERPLHDFCPASVTARLEAINRG